MTATAPLDLVHRSHRTHDRRLDDRRLDDRRLSTGGCDRRLLDRRLLDRRLLDRRLLDRRLLDRRLLDRRFLDRRLLGRALANDRGFRARVGDLMVAARQRGDALLVGLLRIIGECLAPEAARSRPGPAGCRRWCRCRRWTGTRSGAPSAEPRCRPYRRRHCRRW